MKTFEEVLAPISGGRVLDVATGRGSFIHTLDATLKDYQEIIGVDTNDESAASFEKGFGGKPVRFQPMDAAQLGFPDASFDTVCIANSLHHLIDLPGVLAEMIRVLKPGGRLVISEMYRDHQTETQMTHVLLHHWWAAIDSAQGIPHNETYTRQQLIEFSKTLEISNWQLHDVAYLDRGPNKPEIIQQLDNAIDLYIQKAEGLPNQDALQQRGEELRQRVHTVGFHGAAALVMLGEK